LTRFRRGRRAGDPGKIFPFLFITIACGAVWVPRAGRLGDDAQDDQPRDGGARPIGFGAMLVEGFVAIMALVAAGS